MTKAPTDRKPILAGLNPAERAKRLNELLVSDTPFSGANYVALQRELTPQEQTMAAIAMGARMLGMWLQQRANKPAENAEEKAAQHLAKWLTSVAPWFAQSESMTIDEFSWLCVQEDPREPGPNRRLFVNETFLRHEQAREQLRRCVGVSLKELPPTARGQDARFDVADLVNAALVGRAGAIATISIRALLQRCEERGLAARGLVSTSALTQNSAIPRVGFLNPTTQDDAPPKRHRAQWYDVLSNVLLQIETGATLLKSPLTRDSLPESAKQLLSIVREACERRKVKPPTQAGTLLKRVHALGWAFGGAGVRDRTGQLRRFADAGFRNAASS